MMLLAVAIAASGSSTGDMRISNAMVFLETNPFGGIDVFDWKLAAPLVFGVLAGFLYARDKR